MAEKAVNDKYEIVGSPITHVDGQGVIDLSKISMKEADYLFKLGVKNLRLKGKPEAPAKPSGKN